MATLTLVLGPMFSGKTSELMRLCRRHQLAKKKCCVVKFRADSRYSGEEVLSSHDLVTCPAVPCTGELLPLLQEEALASAAVIAVDEGQFYTDLPEFLEEILSRGKTVIVSALDGDFMRRPFGRILECIPMAEEVVKISAVCSGCGGQAAFTRRIAASLEIQMIGGAESYVPNCRRCFEEGNRGSPAHQNSPPRKAAAVGGVGSGATKGGSPTLLSTT